MIEKPNAEIVWTRRGKSSSEPVLVARRVSGRWLETDVQTMQVRLAGPLERVVTDLLDAARSNRQINLPVVALRAALIAALDGLIAIERDLGLLAPASGQLAPPAVELYPVADSADIARIRKTVAKTINRWCLDTLEPWAEKHGLSDLAQRVRTNAQVENISITLVDRPLRRKNGDPDFALIAREIAERLVGQTLFPGMGPCELVLSPEYADNSIELMTPPRASTLADDVFSMVARLSVVTVPYSSDVLLSVNAVKRVWSGKVPGNKPNAPKGVRGYVFSPGRPIFPVLIERDGTNGWRFSESYAAIRILSRDMLPESLASAVSMRTMDEETGWWVGLPQSPRLFDSLAPRTVLETDDLDLLRNVAGSLPGILDGELGFRAWPMPKRNAKSHIAMLKVSDFVAGARAGDAIELDDEFAEDDVAETERDTSPGRLERHREQNVAALRAMHQDVKPVLWAFGGNPDEQDLIRKTVSAMFGDAVQLNIEALPTHTHGLRNNLPLAEADARTRFEARVEAWRKAANVVASTNGPRFALICAADQENRRAEDSVNYYAGMHAMCSIGQANVHHVLPISGGDPEKAAQGFVHRLQSALLDVFLAHSGIVFGVSEFLKKTFSDSLPQAVYGVQAMRSKARAFTGETNVSFLIFSRLIVRTGTTEVQFVYRSGTMSRRTEWLPLAEGLRWLGANRQLHGGDERWLRATFKDSVREALGDIGQCDPRAIVLIDWNTVRGLWQGIADRDLADNAPPSLGGIDLSAAFPSMSIVRLRRGADSIALRSLKRLTFEGWRQSAVLEPTGERHVEEYATTTKTLVQLQPDSGQENPRASHFIVTMGYSKTAQIRRGMSCYRTMSRMVEADESKLFKRRAWDPARLDAPIPAPLEITVMSTPADVSPHAVALAVTGLRLGYAHYNDWTALPAPLFFKRKIDDYVIRFTESASANDDAENAETGTLISSDAMKNPLANELVKAVLQQGDVQVNHDVSSGEEPEKVDEAAADSNPPDDASPGDDPLLDRAKRVDVRALYADDDLKAKRLYGAMMQEAVQVSVDLPSFVNPNGLFGQYEPGKRRAYDRAWESQRRFGYVRKTDRRPPTTEILDHIAQRLRIPQAAFSINSPHLFNGNIMFPAVLAILDQYNIEAAEPIAPHTVVGLVNLGPVAKWASENGNDHALAWLIFYAAQMPAYGCAKTILSGISKLPDNAPLAEEALGYYLDCADAVEQAYAQRRDVGRSFKPIRISRERAVTNAGTTVTSDQNRSVGEAKKAQADISSARAVKGNIVELVNGLIPGDDAFPSTMASVGLLLERLQKIHGDVAEERARLDAERQLEELERARLEADLAIAEARRRALESEALDQISKLRDIPEFAAKAITAVDCSSMSVEHIGNTLEQLRRLTEEVVSRQSESDEIRTLPLPLKPTAAARAKKMAEELAAINAIADAVACLEDFVDTCGLFSVEDVVSHSDDRLPDGVGAPADSPEPAENSGHSSRNMQPCPPSDTDEDVDTAVTADVEFDMPAQKRPAQSVHETSTAPLVTLEAELLDESGSESVSAEDPDEGEFNLMDPAERHTALETLLKLTVQRRYALAQVHTAALTQMLPESVRGSHSRVLNALFAALDSLDCRLSVDGRLDGEFSESLKQPLVPGELSHPLHLALGVFAAGLTNMLFDGPGTDTRWTVLSAVQDRFAGQPALSELAERIGSIDTSAIVLSREKLAASHVGVS